MVFGHDTASSFFRRWTKERVKREAGWLVESVDCRQHQHSNESRLDSIVRAIHRRRFLHSVSFFYDAILLQDELTPGVCFFIPAVTFPSLPHLVGMNLCSSKSLRERE